MQTPVVVRIDLGRLYDAFGMPSDSPSVLAMRLAEYYGAKVVIAVDFPSDVPPGASEYYFIYAAEENSKRMFNEIYEKAFEEWDGYNTPELWEKFLTMLSEAFNATVIEVYDGYDTAIVVARKDSF